MLLYVNCITLARYYHQHYLLRIHRIREVTFINYFINRQTNFTIPPPGQYFQWTNFVILGGFEPCIHLPTFTVRRSPNWTTRHPFVWMLLQAIFTQPLRDYHGLPSWISKSGESVIIPLNPCKIYLDPDYFVTPAGLEPATPTLKVSCSTSWAKRSFHIFQPSTTFLFQKSRIYGVDSPWTISHGCFHDLTFSDWADWLYISNLAMM